MCPIAQYFLKARDQDGLWRFEQCPNGCVFEQLWSWTTGKFQVVLSTPSTLKQVPVTALSISMKPLLEAVLPPGFEFAIIDQDGQVQFHGDKQRIVNENLLVETDQDARLRSLVATHGAGTLNMSYRAARTAPTSAQRGSRVGPSSRFTPSNRRGRSSSNGPLWRC